METLSSLAVMAGAAFVAATLLPAQSEAVFVGLLAAKSVDPLLLFAVASLANTAGSVVNWWLGRLIAQGGLERLPARLRPDPKRFAQAQGWFERAARKGHVDAQTTLGLLLFQNGNRVAAMRWLNGAAEAGEPRALLMVGTALYNGDGVPEDHVKAYAYVSRAAAQGLAPAKATLADMDSVMPLEQRQKGIALAKQLASGKKAVTPPAVAKAPPPALAPKAVTAKPSPPPPPRSR